MVMRVDPNGMNDQFGINVGGPPMPPVPLQLPTNTGGGGGGTPPPTNPQATDPLATLAAAYMAAMGAGGTGSAAAPQYAVLPPSTSSGSGLSLGPIVILLVLGVIGFVGYKFAKKKGWL